MQFQRGIRLQGAVIKDNKILLIRHLDRISGRSYWVIPGGGRQEGETDKDCVAREILEETHLKVRVEKLLIDLPALMQDIYKSYRTYLCSYISGVASPGSESGSNADNTHAIVQVRWFEIDDPRKWSAELKQDPYTFPQLIKIREGLGFNFD